MNYLGIDVSKARLDCALLRSETGKVVHKSVANTGAGIKALLAWLTTRGVDAAGLPIIMEPTGVYHEQSALALSDAGGRVSLVNPARLRSYAQAIGVVSKTDRLDAVVLARYGQAEQPPVWQAPSAAARELTALLQRREALNQDILRERNRQEKALHALATPSAVTESLGKSIEFLHKQLAALDTEIRDHIDRDPTLKSNDKLLRSINGVGPRVAQRMNALLSAHRFDSAEQLASYLGLAPVEHQSGSSVRGKTRLSKRGPAAIRRLLYLPAVVASKHNPHIKATYERMLAKGKSKMSAIGAAMRKLAHLCFGVLHSQKPFNPNYNVKTNAALAP